MKKSFTFWNILPLLLIISGVAWITFRYMIKRKQAREQPPDVDLGEVETVEEDEAPSMDKDTFIQTVYKEIRQAAPDNISNDFVKILTAQAMHETGVFTSVLFREQNNLFGMKHPVIRDTTSTGAVRGYANYTSLGDSVTDLLLWMKEFNVKPTYKDPKDYVKDIRERGYFTAPFIEYWNGVRSHHATVKNLIQ